MITSKNLFPITCVDDFYSDPDKIRDFALSLDYSKKEDGNYPGERSQLVHKISPHLFDVLCNKVFSLFFDFNSNYLDWKVQSYFQKIYPFESSIEDSNEVNSGWTHVDDNTIFAGVIYLNPNPSLDSGTSIYEADDIDENEIDWSVRNNFYNKKGLPPDEYAKIKSKHNLKFHKTVEFKNVYNRMIMYSGSYWHRHSGFLMKNEDFRLTQVFFVTHLKSNYPPPCIRCQNYNF
jgi:hypothetical protein